MTTASRSHKALVYACVAGLFGVELLVSGCRATMTMPPPPPPDQVALRVGIATLSPVFADYQLGTMRSNGEPCTMPSGATELRYAQSLEYTGAGLVAFGLRDQCIVEIRAETGQFDHAVSYAADRLGDPDGEDEATCATTGEALQAVYWMQPEGRFAVVRMGLTSTPEYVLSPTSAPMSYQRLCAGNVDRDSN